MTTFQETALLLAAAWLLIVAIRFRTSTVVLIGGLVAIAVYIAAAVAYGAVTVGELGFVSTSWVKTIGYAVVWTGVMLAYSPVADWLATQIFAKPPTLDAFRAIQESTLKLVAGIAVAWVLGGFLEELVFRGVLLRSIEDGLTAWFPAPISSGIAVLAAAIGAGLIHFYQGPRAMVIITQLSILFGVLFVISGHDLLAVMLCHGLYDTIAFTRFAQKKSKYSTLER